MTELKDLEITYDKPNWCPGCVLPSTFIQTNPSAAKVTEIKKGKRVIGSDGKPHEVTKTFSHVHTGVMYSIASKYFGVTTLTPEHPVLAVRRKNKHKTNLEFRSEWIEAAELRTGDYLQYPVLKEVRNVDVIPLVFEKKLKDTRSKSLPPSIPLRKEFCLLAGYFITEGYIHKREICFTFHMKETQYADEVISLMYKLFGLAGRKIIKEEKNTIDVIFNSSYLAEQFTLWFGTGALNKKIPDFLMYAALEKQKSLLTGLWRGDGWISEKTRKASYKTISKILCEQVKMLLLRHGILPAISVYQASGIHKTSYALQIRDPHDYSLLRLILGLKAKKILTFKRYRPLLTKDFAFLPIKKIEKSLYNGPVHNFEVKTENAYVTENAILHNCGDFGIWVSLKNAIVQLNLNPWEVVLVSGIGCSSKLPYWVRTYGFNGLHGRPIPPAEGIKLANQGLTVIVIGGDGDQYGEGLNHWLHAARRNIDITLIVHNNQIYGLTTGQFSPATQVGEKNKANATPLIEAPVNPMSLALSSGATFVARGFAGDNKQETELIKAAIQHKGFAIVDTMQPCVTFNHHNTFSWFYERVYKLESEGHDPKDKAKAFARAEEWPAKVALKEGEKERVPTGIFYQEDRPVWEESVMEITEGNLLKHDIRNRDITPLLQELM